MIHKHVTKGLWLGLGLLFLVLAVIGLMLPVVPQLSFLLISLLCFMRCSQRVDAWIRRQRWFEKIRKHLPHRHR
jgi:uncharacterized membrane protein YbaN (DUF454 family)